MLCVSHVVIQSQSRWCKSQSTDLCFYISVFLPPDIMVVCDFILDTFTNVQKWEWVWLIIIII